MDTLWQLSDIHIRPKYKTYDRVRHAAAQLKYFVEKSPGPIGIIGDIFDSNNINEDDVNCFRDLLETFSVPIVVIEGNHDGDTVKNVIKQLALSNVYYLANDETLVLPQYPEIMWHAVSTIRETVLDPAFKHVAMAHIEEGVVDSAICKQFDAVMLGHVHRPKKMADNAVYSTSFVHRDLDEWWIHGVVKWSADFKPTYVELKEIHARRRFIVRGGILSPAIKSLANFESLDYVRIDYEHDTPVEVIKRVRNDLIEAIGQFRECPQVYETFGNIKEKMPLLANDKLCRAIGDHLFSKHNNGPHRIEIAALSDQLEWSQNTDNTIKLLWLKWSNFTCYGPDNYINFDESHSIHAPNGTGKSTIIDILSFVFRQGNAKMGRYSSIAAIVRNNLTVTAECALQHDGIVYVIRKICNSAGNTTTDVWEQITNIRKPISANTRIALFNKLNHENSKFTYVGPTDCDKVVKSFVDAAKIVNIGGEFLNKRDKLRIELEAAKTNLKREDAKLMATRSNYQQVRDDIMVLDNTVIEEPHYENDVAANDLTEHDEIPVDEIEDDYSKSDDEPAVDVTVIDIEPLLNTSFIMKVADLSSLSYMNVELVCKNIMQVQYEMLKEYRRHVAPRNKFVTTPVAPVVQINESSRKTYEERVAVKTRSLDAKYAELAKLDTDLHAQKLLVEELTVKLTALECDYRHQCELCETLSNLVDTINDEYGNIMFGWQTQSVRELLTKQFDKMGINLLKHITSPKDDKVLANINGYAFKHCSEFQQKIFGLVMELLKPHPFLDVLFVDCLFGSDGKHHEQFESFLSNINLMAPKRKLIMLNADSPKLNACNIEVTVDGSKLTVGSPIPDKFEKSSDISEVVINTAPIIRFENVSMAAITAAETTDSYECAYIKRIAQGVYKCNLCNNGRTLQTGSVSTHRKSKTHKDRLSQLPAGNI